MKASTRRHIVLFSGLLLAGCNLSTTEPVRPTPAPITIISLKENLPLLQEAARSWYPDSYFVDAYIPVRTVNHHSPLLISAGFRSPTSEHESLLVRLLLDGSTTVTPIEHTSSVGQFEPMADSELPLDSQEAFDLMLDEDARRFFQSSSSQCSFLILERNLRRPDPPILWRLTLTDCSQYVRHIQLDPFSKEILTQQP